MDEKVVTAIHELANALAGLGSWQQQLVSMAILLVVAAGGSFFGAYLKTRATNAAMADDLVKIRTQLETTTATTETIKSQIGKRGELHSLRIKKLEELMESFLTAREAYRAAFQSMLKGEKPDSVPHSSHLVMLARFYFPDLKDAIDPFVDKWQICLDETNHERAARVGISKKEHIPLLLALWRREPPQSWHVAETQGQEVEIQLVLAMRKLLSEVGPNEAGHAPA